MDSTYAAFMALDALLADLYEGSFTDFAAMRAYVAASENELLAPVYSVACSCDTTRPAATDGCYREITWSCAHGTGGML